MPLARGQVLKDRYRIDALLGQGGMGAVYLAHDLNLGVAVVVKENLLHTPAAQRQFAREAALLASLGHPNLPRVTDCFFRSGQGRYLVMDYIEGQDLNQVLARRRALPEAQALGWIDQVLQALEYLHGRNVIHRDVKPSNVRITAQGHLYLVDLGLAKGAEPGQSATTGAQVVTPGYTPPEQYGLGRADERTDLYSAGATLYALLTGCAPPDALELVTGQARLTPPRQLNPRVSAAVDAAVVRAMQSRPADRFQTIAQFRAALAAGEVTQPATRDETISRHAEPEPELLAEPARPSPVAYESVAPVTPETRRPDRPASAIVREQKQPAPREARPEDSGRVRERPRGRPGWFWLVIGGAVAAALVIMGGLAWRTGWLGAAPTPTNTPAPAGGTSVPATPVPSPATPTASALPFPVAPTTAPAPPSPAVVPSASAPLTPIHSPIPTDTVTPGRKPSTPTASRAPTAPGASPAPTASLTPLAENPYGALRLTADVDQRCTLSVFVEPYNSGVSNITLEIYHVPSAALVLKEPLFLMGQLRDGEGRETADFLREDLVLAPGAYFLKVTCFHAQFGFIDQFPDNMNQGHLVVEAAKCQFSR